MQDWLIESYSWLYDVLGAGEGPEGDEGCGDFAAFGLDDLEELFGRAEVDVGYGVGIDGFEVVDGVEDGFGLIFERFGWCRWGMLR